MSELLVYATAPDLATAQNLAKLLIEQKLAACVNILPQIHSVYRWQGKVEQSTECAMIMKSTADRYDALEKAFVASHPYDCPALVAVPISHGFAPFRAWITENVAG